MHLKGDARRMAPRGTVEDRLRYLNDLIETTSEMRIAVIQREQGCSREEALVLFRREWDWHNQRKVERWRKTLEGDGG